MLWLKNWSNPIPGCQALRNNFEFHTVVLRTLGGGTLVLTTVKRESTPGWMRTIVVFALKAESIRTRVGEGRV